MAKAMKKVFFVSEIKSVELVVLNTHLYRDRVLAISRFQIVLTHNFSN